MIPRRASPLVAALPLHALSKVKPLAGRFVSF
jgi:hypothetical protein